MSERTCKKCGETKPLETDFYKNKLSREGYLNACKECVRAAQRAYEKTDAGRAKTRRALHKYNRTDYGRQKNAERAREYRKTEQAQTYRASLREAPVQMDGTRVCTKCSEEKPVIEFHKSPGGAGNRAAHCKVCHYERHKRYRKPPAGKAARQKANLTRDYKKEMAHVHNRQARVANAPGRGVTHEEWLGVLERFGERCYYCGAEGLMTRDHIEPLQKGGAHETENLVPACKSCNSAKGPRFLLEWAMSDPERFIPLGA